MVDGSMFDLIGLYRHYKNSVLPYSGGVYEQPNYYLRVMELMDEALNDND